MENRYQQFLKDTLKPGILALQQNPSLKEVNGIPLTTFNILVRAFRAGLSEEYKIALPHDLKNLAYLEELLKRIDFFITPGIPEETTLANVYSLPWLVENYENAQKTGSNQKNWQLAYEKQVADFNRKIIAGVQTELEKNLPSLADKKEEILKPLAIDIARTVADALPEASSPEQARELVERVTQTALKTYASTAKEVQENSELTDRIAQSVAEENETEFQDLIKNRTAAPFSPIFNTQLAIEEAIVANLPPSVYRQNPQIVREIANQAMGRLSLPGLTKKFTPDGQIRAATLEEYQTSLAAEITRIINSAPIQESIQKTGLTMSPEQQEKMTGGIVAQVGPTAMAWSGSVEATQVGVTMGAGFGAAQAAAAAMGAIGGMPSVGGGTAGMVFSEGSLGDVMMSSGGPLHLFTSLSSPRGAQDIAKWIITAGPVRTAGGFFLDSFPGMPKFDYLGVSLLNVGTLRAELTKTRNDLADKLSRPSVSDLNKYQWGKDLQEAEKRLGFVNRIVDTISKSPSLSKAYDLYFGRGRWLFHPLRSFQQWALNKNILAGIGVSGVTESLMAYFKYGGYGGSYVTTEILKQWGTLATKFALTKIGLYEIVGLPGQRHFVFKPTHELAVRAQKWIAGTAAGKAVKNAIMEFLKKLGLDTLLSGLSGGVYLLLKAAWWLIKKVWKPIAASFLYLLYWLFSHFSVGEALLSLTGGFVTGGILSGLFGFWGWLFGFFGGTALTALALQFFKGLLSSVSHGLMSGLGNLLSGITGMPGLAGTASPIFGFTGLAVGIPAGVYFFVVSSAFVQQGLPTPVQSEYVTVSKGVSFSGKVGDPINYVVIVTPQKSRILITQITDTATATCRGTPPTIPVRTFGDKIPKNKEVLPGSPLTLTYQLPTDQTFNDCLITNVVQVEVSIPDEQRGGEKSFTTNNVSIGNPPVVVPVGPPLKGNVCLSGFDFNEREPNGTIHNGIDLFSNQATVYSPFLKESKVLNACKSPACLSQAGGFSITLGLGPFALYFGHLAGPPPYNVGDTVPAGGIIGTMGNTGNSTGPHLHYITYLNGKAVDPHSYGVNVPKCP